ncbi:MAG: phosphate ABC transporter substrate-binding protein [bacterium]
MKKFLNVLAVGLLSMVMLTGCGSSDDSGSSASSNGSDVSGKVVLNGSTSMETLSSAFIEVFADINPNIQVTAEFTGSSAGIESLSTGMADIGNASRALKNEELAVGIIENIVAMDGIAIIVDPANEIDSLTMDELVDIYEGNITNWSELGGVDMGIVVIGRESGSGTRSAFEEILGISNPAYAQEIDSTGAVVGKVETTPATIGYVSLDVLEDSSAKTLALEGVQPSIANIKNNSYSLARPFVMATNGEINEQTPAVQEFFEFIDSSEGQEIIELVGLVSLK